ncbi:MAG: Ppx/GppA family phosphatase [Myxococcaceae bacterium]
MPRYAAIDIGTNSVLLLVAEKSGEGFRAVEELAEITRLGRGVDKSRVLSAEGMEATLSVLEEFGKRARELGAEKIAVSATSAARDAKNGAEFMSAAKTRAGVEVEIISGELEAQLSYSAVAEDASVSTKDAPLIVIDIGGGSTEFIFGDRGKVLFRHSFDVGSVRLTERFVTTDPVSNAERTTMKSFLSETFSRLPKSPPRAQFVGVAGTVTTLFAVHHAVQPYDVTKVHGGVLHLPELRAVTDKLFELPVAERAKLPGLQPKRADVICAGSLILLTALEQLRLESVTVSDRGLRWGLLAHKFGGA